MPMPISYRNAVKLLRCVEDEEGWYVQAIVQFDYSVTRHFWDLDKVCAHLQANGAETTRRNPGHWPLALVSPHPWGGTVFFATV